MSSEERKELEENRLLGPWGGPTDADYEITHTHVDAWLQSLASSGGASRYVIDARGLEPVRDVMPKGDVCDVDAPRHLTADCNCDTCVRIQRVRRPLRDADIDLIVRRVFAKFYPADSIRRAMDIAVGYNRVPRSVLSEVRRYWRVRHGAV